MVVTLFLVGDAMTGRGTDQILPGPGDPAIDESWRNVRSAHHFVDAAERLNGAIPRPVAFDHVWGDALPELERACRPPGSSTSKPRSPRTAPASPRPSAAGCIRKTSAA